MKKIKILVSALIIAGFGFTFTSCSDDDDEDNNNNSGIAGTYKLSEFNTEDPTDFDMDGTSNIDQTEESNCYDDSKIVLSSDNTFTYDRNYILVDEGAGTSACADADYTGTWEIFASSGSTVVITATYQNENDEEVTMTLTKQGNTLTETQIFSEYPDRNDADGAILTNGDVELVYTKQ